jgi:hypothetical protein
MSNVKKNFQTKGMLRHMADGGFVRNNAGGQFNGPQRAVDAMAEGRDPNEDRMKKGAEFGMPAGAPHQPAHTVTPTEVIGMAKAKFSQLRKAVGLANGGRVEGEGGPTDDKIDAKLSNGEFVLPADTVEHLGVENLEALVARTHKPTGKSALRDGMPHLADGAFIPDIETRGSDFRPPRMDPLEEMKRRVAARTANPSGGVPRPVPAAVPPAATPPPDGLVSSEISRSEFDAARARAAGRVPADLPVTPSNTLSVDAARAARAARYGEPGAGAAGKLGAFSNSVKSGIASRAGSALRGLGATAALGVEGYRVLNSPDPVAELPRAGGRLAGAYAGARVGSMLPGGARVPGALVGGAIGYAGGEKLVDDLTRSDTMTGNPITHEVGLVPNAMDIADYERGLREMRAGNVPPGIQLITGEAGDDNHIPDSQKLLPAVFGQAPGVASGSVASSADARGRPTYDNASLLRMQARNGQPAVTDSAPSQAPQEDPIQGALRQLLRQQGGGVGMVNSRAGSINNQFDALQKQITDTYGGKAQGTMISKLLDLQKARADALGQDQGALVNSQGNVVNADNSVRSQQASALGDMAGMRNNDSTNQTSLLREQLQGIREADQAQRAGVKDNRDNFFADIQAQAPVDKDGNPVAGFRPDEIMARLAKTNPEVMNMDRASRAQLIASSIAAMQNGQDFNNTRGLMGTEDSTATPQGAYKADTNLMDAAAMYTGGNSLYTIGKHVLNPFRSDAAVNMGVDADGNPVLAYQDDVSGDERFRQEVTKSALRKKEK